MISPDRNFTNTTFSEALIFIYSIVATKLCFAEAQPLPCRELLAVATFSLIVKSSPVYLYLRRPFLLQQHIVYSKSITKTSIENFSVFYRSDDQNNMLFICIYCRAHRHPTYSIACSPARQTNVWKSLASTEKLLSRNYSFTSGVMFCHFTPAVPETSTRRWAPSSSAEPLGRSSSLSWMLTDAGW